MSRYLRKANVMLYRSLMREGSPKVNAALYLLILAAMYMVLIFNR